MVHSLVGSIFPLFGQFPWTLFFGLLSFTWGACIGSFLNVCIHRIPRGESLISPGSHCPKCHTPIPWYLNIPILSYLLLRGRCRFCGATIICRYVLVETLTAVLFLLIWFRFAPVLATSPDAATLDRPVLGLVPLYDWRLVPVYWLVVSGLILGTFVDCAHLIIPDRVTLGGIVAGTALSALIPALHGETEIMRSLLWSTVGTISGVTMLWLIAVVGRLIFRKDAMGMGDVKLLGAVGAFLGTKAVFFTLVMGSFVGSVAGVLFVLLGRKKMQSRIPFGPYLALSSVIWMLWGPTLWNMYLRLIVPMPVH